MAPDRGALRHLRSGVLAVAVLVLAAGAHALAGGHLPSPGALAATGAGVLLVCSALTRRRLGAPSAAAALAGGQLALHRVFEALAGGPAAHAAPAAPVALLAEHAHHAGAAGQGPGGALWLGGPSAGDVTMLLAHAAAAVALGLVLARGEDALWGLCAWLAPLAVLLLTPVAPVVARPRTAAPGAVLPVPRPELLRTVSRRGPPLLRAA